MPLPTLSDVHVNRPLTNISIAMIQDDNNFVAQKVFPNIPVSKQSDSYFTYDNAYWNSDEMQDRAPATESHGNGWKIDANSTYFAKVAAFHKDIDDQIRANQDTPLNLDNEATKYCTLKALLRREKLFVTNFMTAGLWTRDYTGVAAGPVGTQVLQWNDAASTPIEDVWDAKEAMLELTGFEPNTLVLGYPVYKALINHPDTVDRVKYGNTSGVAMIDLSELAQLFKVDRVLVAKGISNTAVEGAAAVNRFIARKVAGLFYVPSSPGLMTPSAGYTFSWSGFLGAGPGGNRIKRFRMEHLSSDRVEIEIACDLKLISADMGSFWASVVA